MFYIVDFNFAVAFVRLLFVSAHVSTCVCRLNIAAHQSATQPLRPLLFSRRSFSNFKYLFHYNS